MRSLFNLLVPRSLGLCFVLTGPTERNFSRTFCCIHSTRKLMCLIRPTPERWKKLLPAALSSASLTFTVSLGPTQKHMQWYMRTASLVADVPAYTSASQLERAKAFWLLEEEYKRFPNMKRYPALTERRVVLCFAQSLSLYISRV